MFVLGPFPNVVRGDPPGRLQVMRDPGQSSARTAATPIRKVRIRAFPGDNLRALHEGRNARTIKNKRK